MQLTAQSLVAEIMSVVPQETVRAAVPQGATPAAAGVAAAAGPADGFCSLWPRAKPILELLAGIAIIIPGAGAAAGAVLKGLIKVGDQLSAQICNT